MEDISDIRDMYDAGWEREANRLERHQLEHDITWCYLDKYLPAAGQILEVGFGTGNYTIELARRGYNITGIDISPNMVNRTKERVAAAGLDNVIHLNTGDGRILSGIPENKFDAALLMGPLYHLVSRNERLMALKRIFACLKVNGILFSSLISRYGVLGNLMKEKPGLIQNQGLFGSHLLNGCDPECYQPQFRGYFSLVDEIRPLHEEAGFHTIDLAGAEPAISADDESYNRLEGDVRQGWLELMFKISTEPSMIASSRHLLYVGRKI
jgi:ubiquinone/menaquinone biosynthesis C-methylase UbiE